MPGTADWRWEEHESISTVPVDAIFKRAVRFHRFLGLPSHWKRHRLDRLIEGFLWFVAVNIRALCRRNQLGSPAISLESLRLHSLVRGGQEEFRLGVC